MNQTNEEFQTIHEIGYPKLLEKLKKYSGVSKKRVIRGIDDDSSVVEPPKDKLTVQSSEILLEGVHFDLTYTPLQHLGYKSVTAAVSDIYAMNAEPSEIMINIAVPNKISVQMIEQFYSGIHSACHDYNVQVTGGNTSASQQNLIISTIATGYADEKDLTYRNGGKIDDLICVTGDLGGALAGLRILLREKKFWEDSGDQYFQPDLDNYEYVIQKQLVPKARDDMFNIFRETNLTPTSMIDVTKGLVTDLKKLCEASETGAEIYSPSVPIALKTREVADEMEEDVDKYAFYGGEDYELLFSMNEKEVEKLSEQCKDFSVIGRFQNADRGIIINTGTEETITIETDVQSNQ
ncbi:MAG TPA: thiamine-phosphate kinase [Balneolaceae bacterium]|nr:thiamine-phosphate kinase [Balneolaceae bacterium]